MNRARRLTGLIVCVFMLVAMMGCTANVQDQGFGGTISQLGQRTALVGGTMESTAQKVSPSVVGIAVGNGREITGIGSGVIVHETGYVLTNFHVAQVGNEISLVFQDGTKAPAALLWGDGALDLAVLKVEGKNHVAAPMGSIDRIQIGETVLVIGTPLTLQFQHTVTHGIVSALGRSLQVPALSGEDELSFMEELIQTDASINPGNSGGPMVNLKGEVIGIVTMKVDEAAGIGFAIPIDIAVPIVNHFVKDGHYETPYFGVSAFDAQIARFFDDRLEMETGLCVIEVAEDSPAALGGVQEGDILLYADGRQLRTMLDLRYCIYSHTVGETMKLDVERGGKRTNVDIVLQSRG